MVVKYQLRLYLLAIAILAGFSMLLLRLWKMQIDDYYKYAEKVPGTRELQVRIPGVRGEIKDRNGVTLVTNKSSYEVIFHLREIVNAYKRQNGEIPKFSYDVIRKDGSKKTFKEADIVRIINEMVISSLKPLGLAVPYSANSLRVHYRSHDVVPWVYRRQLSFEEFARFAEHNLGLPGVSITARPIRHYVYDSLACHILGYVRLPNESKVSAEEKSQWDFYVGDDYGVSGIEKTSDEDLRGVPGVRTLLRNERGVLVGEVGYQAPKPGSDVHLTIDARIQHLTEKLMLEAGVGRGSAVVLDPKNGDVLAMCSVPSYSPNKFIPNVSVEEWDSYRKNKATPLVNRSIIGFPPGSTYKIPVALAGCPQGLQSKFFKCRGGVKYGKKFMRCWIHEKGGTHGYIGLSESIKRSCNAFFYLYGNQAGIRNIVSMGRILGLGTKTGIELPGESPGILPGPSWLKQNRPGSYWTPALTALVSIGQGDVLATPLQMAAITAAVANGNQYHQPRLIHSLANKSGKKIDSKNDSETISLSDEGVSQEQIETIRKGMYRVVNDKKGGTGAAAKIKDIKVAGKTGTAQAWRTVKGARKKDNNAWFISFAPYDAPEVAVCILVEGGKSGGSVAAPIAKKIIEASILQKKSSDYTQVRSSKESSGHFNFIEKVTFEEDGSEANNNANIDGDTGLSEETPTMARAVRPASTAAQQMQIHKQKEAPSLRPKNKIGDTVDPTKLPIIPKAIPFSPR